MPHASASPDRRATLALVVAFVLLLPAITARLNASDEIEFFAWLRSWTFDRDVNFENEYRYFHDQAPDKHTGLRQTFLEGLNEAGRRPNFTPIGTAILWSPFYLAGHLVALATDAPEDGFSRPYLAAVTFGSAVYGLAALLLSAAFTRRAFGRPAGWAAWIVWLGTPLLFYMYVAPGFSHAASAFVVALFLWVWLRVRQTWTPRGALALGATAALLPMIREQDAFFVIGPAVDFLVWSWRRLRDAPTGAAPAAARAVGTAAVAGVVAAVVTYVPQALAYLALNGHVGPTSTVTRKMSWSSPHFLGVLFSPEHGLLFWTPLVIVAAVGLVAAALGRRSFAADQRWMATLLLAMVVAQAYISGAVESWTVAGSFGQRRFVAITPMLVTGVAIVLAMVRTTAPQRTIAAVTLGLAIWWNVGLMVLFGLHLMDRQRLEPGRNAVAVFWQVPRDLPLVAWRYLTARESLYDLPRRE